MPLTSRQKRIMKGILATHDKRSWKAIAGKAPFLIRMRGKKALNEWNERMEAERYGIRLELHLYGKYMVNGEWDRFDGAQKEFFVRLFARMGGHFLPKTAAEREWNRIILTTVRGVVGKLPN